MKYEILVNGEVYYRVAALSSARDKWYAAKRHLDAGDLLTARNIPGSRGRKINWAHAEGKYEDAA